MLQENMRNSNDYWSHFRSLVAKKVTARERNFLINRAVFMTKARITLFLEKVARI